MDNKNPKLRKNGGKGTFFGNLLRGIVGVGKTVSPQLGSLLDAFGIGDTSVGLDSITAQLAKEGFDDNELKFLLGELELDRIEMTEVTKRHLSDNEHPITRLVRPVTYTLFTILFFALVFFDGNLGEFKVEPQYIPVIQSLYGTMTVFYFGSRGLEKVAKTWKGK